MEFLVCELDKVKEEYPNYAQAANDVLEEGKGLANEHFGMNFGGMFPGTEQYGMTTALPKFFTGYAGSSLTTFRQDFDSSGWQDIFNMSSVTEDIILGGLGFAFTGSSVNITELRMEIGDTKYPRIDIEEINTYDQPAVVLEKGWIGVEEESFKLRGYVESTGYQRTVPLEAFTLYKKKSDVITE